MKSRALVVVWMLVAACGEAEKPGRAPGNELTIVVESDPSKVAAAEKELEGKRATLEAERESVKGQLDAVRAQRSAAALDEGAKSRLDGEEARLRAREQELWASRDALEGERSEALRQRNELSARLAAAQGGTDAVAGREAALALREQDLAVRERELARREGLAAERESVVARREAAAGIVPEVAVASARAAVSRGDSDHRHKLFLAGLQARGLVLADLPPEAQGSFRDADKARKAGEHATALALYDRADAALRELKVDAAFVSAKMKRAGGLRARAGKLDARASSEVERRFVAATELFADAKYGAANAEINQLLAILER